MPGDYLLKLIVRGGFEMKASVVFVLFLLLCPIHALGTQGPVADGGAGFKVSLPEGLYLYQPSIEETVFSPLFIVEGGALRDPYIVAEALGAKGFHSQYLNGMKFNVYVERELFGVFTDAQLDIFSNCTFFKSNINVSGVYSGRPLPKNAFYDSMDRERQYYINHSAVKAFLAPQGYSGSIKRGQFNITEEDAKMVLESAGKNFRTELRKIADRILARGKWVVTDVFDSSGTPGEPDIFDTLAAVDLDGNGKKDIIGTYGVVVKYTSGHGRTARTSFDVLFTLWDSGMVEMLPFMEGTTKLGGLIDMDGDGVEELIIVVDVADTDVGMPGEQVRVFRHTASGWVSVFQTELLCLDYE